MSKALPTDGEEVVATVGYLWHNILTVRGNPGRRYLDYNNSLDCLSASHVSYLAVLKSIMFAVTCLI